MDKFISYLSLHIFSRDVANHAVVRLITFITWLVIVFYCLFKDPASHNTIIMSATSFITALCGVHAVGQYFGTPTSTTPD